MASPAASACPVCLDPLEEPGAPDPPVTLTPCGHRLHGGCLRQLSGAGTGSLVCPRCQADASRRPETPAAEDCPICFERLTSKPRVNLEPCRHEMHGACIGEWMARSGGCPVCRSQIQTLAAVPDRPPGEFREWDNNNYKPPKRPADPADDDRPAADGAEDKEEPTPGKPALEEPAPKPTPAPMQTPTPRPTSGASPGAPLEPAEPGEKPTNGLTPASRETRPDDHRLDATREKERAARRELEKRYAALLSDKDQSEQYDPHRFYNAWKRDHPLEEPFGEAPVNLCRCLDDICPTCGATPSGLARIEDRVEAAMLDMYGETSSPRRRPPEEPEPSRKKEARDPIGSRSDPSPVQPPRYYAAPAAAQLPPPSLQQQRPPPLHQPSASGALPPPPPHPGVLNFRNRVREFGWRLSRFGV